VLLIFFLNLTGCALLSSAPKIVTQQTLKNQLEELFRRQNKATSEVMMFTMDEPDAEVFEELLEAEQQMLQACDPLNEYAVRELDQLSLGIMLKNKVLAAMDDCEDATELVEIVIKEMLSDFENDGF
jgi:hypothetical protein